MSSGKGVCNETNVFSIVEFVVVVVVGDRGL
jgi:hypothetical protein